jgi:hypothetical protein
MIDKEVLGSLLGQPRHQFAEFFKPKHAVERQTFVSGLQSILRISNEETIYQLKHGKCFGQLLEPRDQVLEHAFNVEEEYSLDEFESERIEFTRSRLYGSILLKIKEFLV